MQISSAFPLPTPPVPEDTTDTDPDHGAEHHHDPHNLQGSRELREEDHLEDLKYRVKQAVRRPRPETL